MNGYYLCNRFCRCARCVCGALMGPVIVITVGILCLLA